MPLVTRIPMVSGSDYRDLTNRVRLGHVCDGEVPWVRAVAWTHGVRPARRAGCPWWVLPEAIILVCAPFASLFANCIWLQAKRPLGAIFAPGARAVTAAL